MTKRLKNIFSPQAMMLGAIMIAGFLLRLHNLAKESLWFDEGNALRLTVLDFSNFLKEGLVQAPLYFKLLKYWVVLFGDSAYSMRFLSLIFGVLAVFAMYKVGELLFDKPTGLLGALITAISPFQIQYSQEVKYYSLMMFLTLLSYYFFLQQFKRSRNTDSLFYILCIAAMLYIHNYAIFIVAAQNLYFFTMLAVSKNQKLHFGKWMSLQLVLGAVYLPWALVVLKQVAAVKGTYWLPRPVIQNLVFTFIIIAGSTKLLKYLFPILCLSLINIEINSGNILHGNLAKSIKAFSFKKWLSNWDYIYLLMLWLLTPVLVPFAASQYIMPIYHYRYTMVASGAFYLLAARGIRNIGFKHIRILVVLFLVIMYGLSLKGYFSTVRKEQWREVISYIEKNARPGDLVLVHQNHCLVNIVNYYSQRQDLVKKAFPENEDRVDSRNINDLEPAIQGYQNIWLIMSHKDDPDELILSTLNQSMQFIYAKQYFGIELYLFVKRK
jgi:mannosyltransferase